MRFIGPAVALSLALLAYGCSGMARGLGVLSPGYGVTPRLLADSHCDAQQFAARVDFYRRQEAAKVALVPRVGQSYCDVLAMLGTPDDVRTVEAAGAPSQLQLYYRTGFDATARVHLVSIAAPAPDSATVVAVTW